MLVPGCQTAVFDCTMSRVPLANEDLSKHRAEAVVAYLIQDCKIPVEGSLLLGHWEKQIPSPRMKPALDVRKIAEPK